MLEGNFIEYDTVFQVSLKPTDTSSSFVVLDFRDSSSTIKI